MLEKPTFIGSIGYTALLCFGVWFFAGMFANMMIDTGGPPAAMAFINETIVPPLIKISPVGLILIHLFRFTTWKNKSEIENEKAALQDLSDRANKSLHSLQSEIQSLARRLHISFPVDDIRQHNKEIQSIIQTHRGKLLKDATPLDDLLERLTQRAKDDKRQLENAAILYENAMRIYTDVSRHVNKIGSMPLIKELEYSHAELTDIKLKLILSKRRWSEFHNVVNSIVEDLGRLKELSAKYEQYEDNREHEEEFAETNEEKAYQIFGILPTATDDQIKKLYKKLALIYHPDASVVNDDERFKEINWAYGVLKAARNMS